MTIPIPRGHCCGWREKKGQMKRQEQGWRRRPVCHPWLLPADGSLMAKSHRLQHWQTRYLTHIVGSVTTYPGHRALTIKERTVKSGCGSCFLASPKARTLEDRFSILCFRWITNEILKLAEGAKVGFMDSPGVITYQLEWTQDLHVLVFVFLAV